MSPVGTGAAKLNLLPDVPSVTNPAAFFEMTSKNKSTPISFDDPGEGGFERRKLPAVGILSRLKVTFVGTATVATAAATSGHDWPYGLIRLFKLAVNGQNDLWSVSGPTLHAHRFVRHPAYDEQVDDFPGTVGGGDSIAIDTHDLHLTWDVNVAMDPVTLIGSLFAQSSAANIDVEIHQATNAQLFSANPANVTIDGTFFITIEHFDVPVDDEDQLVLPDLSRLHTVNELPVTYTNTGEVRTTLVRGAGQLTRLYVSLERDTNNRLSALPSSADADTIDSIRLEYGGNRRPLVYDPAALLLAENNEHYGAPVPYDRLVFDFVKENPPRDAVYLEGVTELAVVPEVNSNVTVTNGEVRVVQEILL